MRKGGAGFRPSEAHGGGWEGLWRGGMETSTVRVGFYHLMPSRKKRCFHADIIEESYKNLFARVAGGGSASLAGRGGSLKPARSASDSKGRENLLDVFAAAGGAADGFLFSYGNKAFKVLSARLADELVNRHGKTMLPQFCTGKKHAVIPISFYRPQVL